MLTEMSQPGWKGKQVMHATIHTPFLDDVQLQEPPSGPFGNARVDWPLSILPPPAAPGDYHPNPGPRMSRYYCNHTYKGTTHISHTGPQTHAGPRPSSSGHHGSEDAGGRSRSCHCCIGPIYTQRRQRPNGLQHDSLLRR